jgi:hypothetical protein
VAAAAEQAFTPYAEKVLEMMKGFMVLTNDEDLCARARATEVVGIVAMAVGRARVEAILPPFIEAAISVSCSSSTFRPFSVSATPYYALYTWLLAGFWIGLQRT